MDQLIPNLIEQLKAPLPGRDAQHKMAHGIRHRYKAPPTDARVACVLALLYPKDGEHHIVLIQRKSNNNKSDRHRGQISFPGGKQEEKDPSLEYVALREAEEEVNVNPEKVKLIGQLTELFIPVSNFLVYPFVGVTDERPNFQAQPSEVAAILEVPLRQLLDPQNIASTDIKIDEHIILKRVPYYNIQDKVIWGATAMMLSEFLTIVEAGLKSV